MSFCIIILFFFPLLSMCLKNSQHVDPNLIRILNFTIIVIHKNDLCSLKECMLPETLHSYNCNLKSMIHTEADT